MKKQYTAQSIKVLQGLEAVRKRPGMYIGSTNAAGMHQLVWEILDNAVDEFVAGYGQKISVIIQPDNQIMIQDHGRGIPTGRHRSGISALEVIFTTLHAGGKFNNQAYHTAGGLHGVGASVVNALSTSLTVIIRRSGQISQMSFHRGGKVKQQLRIIGPTRTTGTQIKFQPDPVVFGTAQFNFELIRNHLQQSALLNSGLTVNLKDERVNPHRQVEYKYEQGLPTFLKLLNEGKKLITPVISLDTSLDQIRCQVVLQMSDDFSSTILSFANNIKTNDGGTHEIGFGQGCVKAIDQFYRKYGYLKPKTKNFDWREIKEGLTAILSLHIPESLIQFEGQTKSKLGTPSARRVVEKTISQGLLFWLSEHRQVAEQWLGKIKLTRNIRLVSKRVRDAHRSDKNRLVINSKLVSARGKDPNQNELFLVEGESAGSTAKQGRNSQFQAVLALKGKFLNAERASLNDVVQNEEIKNIIAAIGGGWGADFDLSQVKYHKVIIMTDADTDGAHIQALLLTFFHRFMQPLIAAGYVFVALPPLYRVQLTASSHPLYINNQLQFDQLLTTVKPFRIQRFKGLGEMNADQLWTTTMDPAVRQLIQIQPSTNWIQLDEIKTIMGRHIQKRRVWIDRHVNFNQ